MLFPQFGTVSVKINVRCKKFKVFLVKASRHEEGKYMSPQKKLRIKTNPDDATDNILKFKASID